MALAVIRFDMRVPGLDPAQVSARYHAALDMAAWADEAGFDMCVLSEHHASEDGYLTSPLVMAAAVAARTTRIPITISALLVPLHDPVRLAEDVTTLDLLSGGRVSFVAGLGYRPVEYELYGRAWNRRGRLLDENLDTMLQAWSGEPFEHNGQTVRVTPAPLSRPHPPFMIGGASEKAAKRAARLGVGLFPSSPDPELAALYREECEKLGKIPGWVAEPRGPGTVFVSEDPDATWAEIGEHLLHDAVTYHDWQPPGQTSAVHSNATTVAELRAEGVVRIVTPEECIAIAHDVGMFGGITHHPMCGGTPPEHGWESLRLFADKVLPHIR